MRTSVTLCAKGTSGVTLVLCRGYSAVPNVLDILGVSPKVLGLLASIVACASASVLFARGRIARDKIFSDGATFGKEGATWIASCRCLYSGGAEVLTTLYEFFVAP